MQQGQLAQQQQQQQQQSSRHHERKPHHHVDHVNRHHVEEDDDEDSHILNQSSHALQLVADLFFKAQSLFMQVWPLLIVTLFLWIYVSIHPCFCVYALTHKIRRQSSYPCIHFIQFID
jgi:hypothetical protein